MFAGIGRVAAVTAMAVPLVAFAAPAAFADQPVSSAAEQPAGSRTDLPLRTNADAPYIWINICVHIPTPGSATLDWCWGF
ncbi:hypothetical protein ABZ319_30365 [Nocardia sp. NPDC005978]|uniref:hypothetical protein n=1 Tax=Nocardia sp. NPDC005978 TaxID=3156725 RepID=UPI00339DBEC5